MLIVLRIFTVSYRWFQYNVSDLTIFKMAAYGHDATMFKYWAKSVGVWRLVIIVWGQVSLLFRLAIKDVDLLHSAQIGANRKRFCLSAKR